MTQNERPKVLIADDEQNIRRVLEAILRRAGFGTHAVGDGQEALELLQSGQRFDAVVTDLKMPRLDGMQLLRRVGEEFDELPVVMITAHGSVNSAVEAVKLGAFDYIEKPFEDKAIRAIVAKAVAHRQAASSHARPAAEEGNGRYGLIGTGPAMQEIFNIIDRVARTPSTVLITGESGTGKELVAKALHQQSDRSEQAFIKINCAAIPETLIESELFGHDKGAFTGAVSTKPGRFELADKGTLLLDEVGEIPGPMQVKLLRALQESEFERVGGLKTIHVDVRLIAATNANLLAATEQGRFREDLYYRLNVVPIRLPPLRERQDDIPLLVKHFLSRFNQKLGKSVTGMSEEAMTRVRRHPWPGNIRELENFLERTLLFCDHSVIQLSDLPEEILRSGAPSTVMAATKADSGPSQAATNTSAAPPRQIRDSSQPQAAAPETRAANMGEVAGAKTAEGADTGRGGETETGAGAVASAGAAPGADAAVRAGDGSGAAAIAAAQAGPGAEERGTPIAGLGESPSQSAPASLKEAVRLETERVEREMILRALEETGGNVTRAAKLLQISRKSLQIKMKELGLRRADEPGRPEGDAADRGADGGDEGSEDGGE